MATVTANIALAYAYVGDLARAEQGLTEAVALYREANERSLEAMALHNLASLMTEQGRLAEAERHYRRAIEDAHALELRELETLASANLAINLVRLGELIDARATAESAVALSRDLGNSGGSSSRSIPSGRSTCGWASSPPRARRSRRRGR